MSWPSRATATPLGSLCSTTLTLRRQTTAARLATVAASPQALHFTLQLIVAAYQACSPWPGCQCTTAP